MQPCLAKKERLIMAKILIVDDDAAVAAIMKAILGSAGHDVTVESHSDLVPKILAKESFDLIISDLFMPHFDGLEMVLQIRKLCKKTPILIVTGGSRYILTGTDELRGITSSAELFGANAILQKPFKSAKLLSTVEDLL